MLEDDRPYWQRHQGVGRPWHLTPKGRRGCILLLVAAFLVVRVALIVGAISLILR